MHIQGRQYVQQKEREMQLQLRKFNPEYIARKNSALCIAVFSKRNSGKSFLIRSLLHQLARGGLKFQYGLAFSATEDSNHFYAGTPRTQPGFIPELFVYSSYDDDAVQRLIARQRTLKKKGIDPGHCFLILDDVLFDKSIWKRESLRFIALNGRHLGITMCLTVQSASELPSVYRSNLDLCFILREITVTGREKLYTYFSGNCTRGMFNALLDQTTQNYECLVVDGTSQSNDMDKIYYWWKASQTPPNFRLGNDKFWQFGKKHLRRDDDDDLDANSSLRHGGGHLGRKMVLRVEKKQ